MPQRRQSRIWSRVDYTDFTTIDWVYDSAKERSRKFAMMGFQKSATTFKSRIQILYDQFQTWMLIIFIGIITGLIAGFIDISEMWISDTKFGFCRTGFYMNRKFCCWMISKLDYCPHWESWTSGNTLESYLFSYIIYVGFGALFAVSAGFLVVSFSPYAKSSGIPEVKTILSGFIIKNFLGFWTLVTKCIGIVLSVASGLSVGKEGPLVHISCCVANICARFVKKFGDNEANLRYPY